MPFGARQAATPASAPLPGKRRALACRASRICAGVSVGSTDSIGATGTSSATLDVQAATVGGTTGGGGGGGLGLGWLAGLGAAVWALRRRPAAP